MCRDPRPESYATKSYVCPGVGVPDVTSATRLAMACSGVTLAKHVLPDLRVSLRDFHMSDNGHPHPLRGTLCWQLVGVNASLEPGSAVPIRAQHPPR